MYIVWKTVPYSIVLLKHHVSRCVNIHSIKIYTTVGISYVTQNDMSLDVNTSNTYTHAYTYVHTEKHHWEMIVYNCYSSFLSHSLGCDTVLVICCHIFWDVTRSCLFQFNTYNISIVRMIMVAHGHTSFTYRKVCAHERSLEGLRYKYRFFTCDNVLGT